MKLLSRITQLEVSFTSGFPYIVCIYFFYCLPYCNLYDSHLISSVNFPIKPKDTRVQSLIDGSISHIPPSVSRVLKLGSAKLQGSTEVS